MSINFSNSTKTANKEILNFLNKHKTASSEVSSLESKEFVGLGNVRFGCILPGVYLRIFDLNLKSDLTLTKECFSLSSLNFILIHKGYYIYKNGKNNESQKVSIDHIFSNNTLQSNSEITLPHHTPMKMVILSIDVDEFKIHSIEYGLKKHLKKLGIIGLKKDDINSGVDKVKLFVANSF